VKLPRDLSGDEVCRALKRLGFEFVRQTGSHRHYTKGGLHPCVPMHREIKPKTLQSILKQANTSIEVLVDNLRKRPNSGIPASWLWNRISGWS
jgi:predicted RNA binding protein YcfA (HicA-like mRNA interferase family)